MKICLLYSCARHTMQSHVCPERLNAETVTLFFLLPPHCREGSIIVGFEVTGSSSPAELLSALEQVAEEALAALKRRFPVEDGSLRVFGKGKAGLLLWFSLLLSWDCRCLVPRESL